MDAWVLKMHMTFTYFLLIGLSHLASQVEVRITKKNSQLFAVAHGNRSDIRSVQYINARDSHPFR
jgi:hypothetical protein